MKMTETTESMACQLCGEVIACRNALARRDNESTWSGYRPNLKTILNSGKENELFNIDVLLEDDPNAFRLWHIGF